MAKKKKPGRKPLPKGEAKASTLRIRLRSEDRDRIRAAAKAADKLESEWARERLLGSLTDT